MSTRYRRFVDAYVEHLNGTKAAIAAGYERTTANRTGSKLLSKAVVQSLIRERLTDSGVSSARTLRELARIAYSDLGECFNEDGSLKKITELPEHVRATVSSVKVLKRNISAGDGVVEDVHEIKLWDKLKALELCGKYHKLFETAGDTNVQIVVSWQDASEKAIDVTPETPTLPDGKDDT